MASGSRSGLNFDADSKSWRVSWEPNGAELLAINSRFDLLNGSLKKLAEQVKEVNETLYVLEKCVSGRLETILLRLNHLEALQ